MKKNFLVILITLMVLVFPTNCFAIYGVEDAAANSKLVQLQTELQNLHSQLNKMNQQLANAMEVGTSINDVVSLQDEIGNIYGQYRDVATEWNKIYKTGEQMADFNLDDYLNYGKEVIDNTEKAMLISAQSQGLATQISSDKNRLQAIAEASKNSNSQLAQQQATNQMLALMIEQNARLTKMMADANNATNSYYQMQIEREKAAREWREKNLKFDEDFNVNDAISSRG